MLIRTLQSVVQSDIIRTLAVRALGVLLTFASTTLTALLLGAAEFGTWSAGLSLALLAAAFAPLGTDRLLVRQLSVLDVPQQQALEVALAHRITAVVGGLLLAAALVAAALCHFADCRDWAKTLLIAAALFIPLTLTWLRQWAAIPIVGTRNAVLPEQVLIPAGTIAALATFWLLQITPSALSAAGIFVGLSMLVWGLSAFWGPLKTLYRSAALRAVDLSLPGHHSRTRIASGIHFLPMALGPMLSQRITPLVVAAGCGFEDIAHFSYAQLITGIPAIPLGIISLNLIPQLARMYKDGNTASQQRLVENATTGILLTAVALSVLILLASPLLPVMLGAEYAPVRYLLPTLLLAMLADCATGPTFSVMQTQGLEQVYTRLLVLLVPIQLLLIYSSGMLLSVHGAALGYLAGRLLWNVAVLTAIRRHRGLLLLPSLRSLQAGFSRLRHAAGY